MMEPGLGRAAAFSLALHLTLFATIVFGIRKPAPVMPASYTVDLVSPSEAPSAGAEDAGTESAGAEEGAALKTPEEAKPSEAELSRHKAESLSALKKKKEDEAYKSDRIGALFSKKKLRQRQTAYIPMGPAAGGMAVEGRTGTTGLDGYFASVRERIWQQWVYPQTQAGGLEAVVLIRILKDGAIRILGIEKSSGSPQFDASALKAVAKTGSVDPPPYEIEVGIRFYL